MSFNSSTRSGVSTAALALALVMATSGTAAIAQDSSSDAAKEKIDVVNDDPMVVVGYRASLTSAVNAKKSRDQVVESVSAEDIGRLPDASIAESIARLPGLTSQRVSGRAQSISIRGLAPDFSTTLLNGREQTSTGDNRAVEYDQYPSEIVNQVLVYKTPLASIVGQGLSGTVDLQTIRPLEYGKHVISIGGRGTYVDNGVLNAGSTKYGYRVNGTYVDQFFDNTLGVALSASYLDEPYQNREFNAWGYAGAPAGAVIGGSKSYNTSTTLKRLGLQGTVEWRPIPELTATLDGFYSDFDDIQQKRGIELPLGFAANYGPTPGPNDVTLRNPSVTNGGVDSGTFAGVKGVVRNDVADRKAKLYSFGYNLKYAGDDGWSAYLDLSYSRTDRNELVLESYAGTGRGIGNGATDTIGFTSTNTGTSFRPTLNYGDYNTILLTSPQGWGGNQTAVNGTRIVGGQDGYYNNRIVRDEIHQYRVEVSKALDDSFISKVRVGLNYTDRSKSLTPDEAFLGLVANTNGTTSVAVPTQFRLGTTNLLYGLGPVISYDPIALLNAGIYQRVPNAYGDVVLKAFRVSEKLLTGYLQADVKQQIGSSELTGNFGVQLITTDQNSRGATAIYLGTNANGSPNIGATTRNNSTDYIDVLPSLNLSLRLPNDWVVRASGAREIIRPRLDDMRASTSYSYNIFGAAGSQFAVVQGNSGNPNLRPWRANAFDLTVEKYFGTRGYIAIQGFYKDLKTYIFTRDNLVNTGTLVLSSPGIDPGTGRQIPIATNGILTSPINGSGGSLYGVEVATTLPFEVFTSALSGFGVTGSGSYTESTIKPDPTQAAFALPGYSQVVLNGTGFFEKWGWNVRGSVRYRSSFLGELSGFGANRTLRTVLAETIYDAQIGYDFKSGPLNGLSVFIQGQNLADTPLRTRDGGTADPRAVIDYQTYGRRLLAGFTFRY
ncbi:MAG: TonB-dependent receptor [Sphingomonas sp. 28-62-20]|uniref:TonB-dependent receptor n=1 Tax=Sphingomonas sp. 28-62-20 TaxID=1970433 RepID=UPI000BCE308A|nr:MAG: TonB-dependent receptor [Sphingomonas sp. 28-62-20]